MLIGLEEVIMNVELRPEDHAPLEKRVADGEFGTAEDALHAAVDDSSVRIKTGWHTLARPSRRDWTTLQRDASWTETRLCSA